MKKYYLQAAGSCLLLTAILNPAVLLAADKERRQFDAHEHGVTTLNIALDNNELVAELEGPAMNFIGFEHPPRTDEQKQAVTDTIALLKNNAQLIAANSAAECTLLEANAEHVTDSDTHSDDHDDDHHDGADESRHSEFVAEYQYRCDEPGKLSAITVGLFERFPLTTEIDTSFLGPDVQTFKKLTPNDPVLKL